MSRRHIAGDLVEAVQTRGRHGGFYTTEYGRIHAEEPISLDTPRSSRATKVDLLGCNERVRFQRPGGGLRITVPESARRGRLAHTFRLTGVQELGVMARAGVRSAC